MKNNETIAPKKRVTLAKAASAEFEERKSIFIGHASPVTSEEEARAFIDAKKRLFHHHWQVRVRMDVNISIADACHINETNSLCSLFSSASAAVQRIDGKKHRLFFPLP